MSDSGTPAPTARQTALESLLVASAALLAGTKYLSTADTEALKQPVCAGNQFKDAFDAVPSE